MDMKAADSLCVKFSRGTKAAAKGSQTNGVHNWPRLGSNTTESGKMSAAPWHLLPSLSKLLLLYSPLTEMGSKIHGNLKYNKGKVTDTFLRRP